MAYVREIEKTFFFDGQSVRVRIKPIEYGDFMQIEKLNRETPLADMMEYMVGLVKKYATLAVPPRAQDGTDVTMDDICRLAYFTNLVGDVGKAVIESGKVANPLDLGASSPAA